MNCAKIRDIKISEIQLIGVAESGNFYPADANKYHFRKVSKVQLWYCPLGVAMSPKLSHRDRVSSHYQGL